MPASARDARSRGAGPWRGKMSEGRASSPRLPSVAKFPASIVGQFDLAKRPDRVMRAVRPGVSRFAGPAAPAAGHERGPRGHCDAADISPPSRALLPCQFRSCFRYYGSLLPLWGKFCPTIRLAACCGDGPGERTRRLGQVRPPGRAAKLKVTHYPTLRHCKNPAVTGPAACWPLPQSESTRGTYTESSASFSSGIVGSNGIASRNPGRPIPRCIPARLCRSARE